MLIDDANSVDKCDQEKSQEDSKIQRPYNTQAANVECNNKSDKQR
jgi:hypothetical protein